MDLPAIIAVIITLAVAAGGATAFFARSRGTETISLLQTNIQAYKDAEKLKDARIVYLEGQLVVKDETIKRILQNDASAK